MEKRFNLNNGTIECSIVIELTDSQTKKLSNKDLKERIHNAAKDFGLDWIIEKAGNKTSLLCQRYNDSWNSESIHELEMDAIRLATFIDELEGAEPAEAKPACDREDKELKFAKELADYFDSEDSSLVSLAIMEAISPNIAIPTGQIAKELAVEMIRCYIKVHDHE